MGVVGAVCTGKKEPGYGKVELEELSSWQNLVHSRTFSQSKKRTCIVELPIRKKTLIYFTYLLAYLFI